jgi:uncharacterized membrane protein YGL010W
MAYGVATSASALRRFLRKTHAMRNATELMISYARFHRDKRNIATHVVGIPLIVLGVGILLSKPSLPVAGLMLTPAWVLWALATGWYLTRGNVALAVAVSAMNFVLMALGHTLSTMSQSLWLTVGVGAFVLGWIIQFVGHYYEGKKPAFVDDITGLIVGPMFVAAEGLFSLGWGRDLLRDIERHCGPTHLRDLHAHATR